MISYIMELPVEPKDAKSRKLRADLAKLLIRWNKNDDKKEFMFLKFAELIYSFCKYDKVVHAQPINSFLAIDEYKMMLDKSNISYWFESAFIQGLKKRPALLTVECDSIEKLVDLFKIIQSEAIVFFIVKATEKNLMLEKKLIKSQTTNYENPFLEEVERYKFFIFYAESHMSLEILGFEDSILSCLMKSLEFEGRLPKT